jgi:hypothetical protein
MPRLKAGTCDDPTCCCHLGIRVEPEPEPEPVVIIEVYYTVVVRIAA